MNIFQIIFLALILISCICSYLIGWMFAERHYRKMFKEVLTNARKENRPKS